MRTRSGLENKAEAYANEVVPQARGQAARQVADAKAYRDRVIAEAEGDSSRFLAVLKQYQLAPEVTRERLYLDAVETMLGQTSKVMLDTAGGNSLMYLPLDKLIQQGGSGYTPGSTSYPAETGNQVPARPDQRETTRGRSVR